MVKHSLRAGLIMLALIVSAGDGADTNNIVSNVKPEAAFPAEVVSVMAIQKSADGKTIYISFIEKEQIFIINTSDKSASGFLKLLERSLKSNTPLKIEFDPIHASIKSVAKPSNKEMELYRSEQKRAIKTEKPVPVDLNKIDTSEFNKIQNLKFPFLKGDLNIVSQETASEIFEYCKKQSCNLPGPYDIVTCIPFQFVLDGCHARAHKMYKMITERFGNCCAKVFSLAYKNKDHLAIIAEKWGGCCVLWRFHVAPIIMVKIELVQHPPLNTLMVIDPSMFDTPVSLSWWLWNQEQTKCDEYAKVSAYTIQRGWAYMPADTGTMFYTDPDYTETDSLLVFHHSHKTCP